MTDVTPDMVRQELRRLSLLNSAQQDIAAERQSAAITGSDSVYEPGIRKIIRKLMVGSHAGRSPW